MSSRARERRRCLEVLGVQEDATDDDIKKAYRRMALIFHPDKNQSEDAKEKFQEIGYAHKYLIEGPSAVGFQEDGQFTGQAGGHDVPINILTRLFPWMMGDFGVARPSPSPFGGLFGHPFSSPFHQSPFQQFFMDPFSGMHGGIDDYDDSDDGEEIVIMQNGRITVIKTGNKGHSRRRRTTQRPQQHQDPFLSRSAHFNNRQSQFHSDNSHTHHPTSDNVHRTSSRFNPRRSSDTSDFHHRRPPTTQNSSDSSDFHDRRSSNSQNSSTNAPNKASYGSGNFNDQFSTGTQSSGSSKVHSTSTQNNDNKDGKSKTKPQTVITSRKERKKQKKANKPVILTKPATSNMKTDDATPEMVESESEDNDSIYDNIDDIETSQVPLKLNKKQRRKLKRERERLEKEMAETSSGNVKMSGKPVPQKVEEVEDDDETSSNSSATNDTEEKRKHADDNIHLFDHLAPQSHQDEEEMIRVAMEMSKMEVNNIDDDTFSQDDTNSNYDNLTDEGQSSKGHDNTSWYDDIGKSPFAKTPMEDMKKTYYKDMSSTNFDPASYYKSSQPPEPRSQNNYSKSNKENFASGHSTGVDSSTSRSNGVSSQGHEPSSKGQSTRYFYSKDYKGPENVGSYQQKPVEQHHQKHFKASTKPYNSHKEKHSFDLDEPDDVPLNLNDIRTRGAPIGSFHTQEVLNGSLNVPKGIHVTQINHVYRKK